MVHTWQRVVVGVVVCVHLLVDVGLAAGHGSGLFESRSLPYDFRENLQIFTLIFLPAQFTLLAMWGAWPRQKRGASGHAVQTLAEASTGADAVPTAGVVSIAFPVRVCLSAAGMLVVYALLLGGYDELGRSPFAVIALPTTQIAVIFLGVQLVGRLTGTRQFSLGTMICAMTLAALLTGLFRLSLSSDAFGNPDAFWSVVLMGIFHAVYSVIVLAALYPFGWLMKLVTLPLALVAISLLALGHVWSLSLFIVGAWSDVIIAVFALLSLAQTATVLVTLLVLRLCSAFGVTAPRDRPSLDAKFWSWLKGFGRRVLAQRA
jgi:hypothetical protein